MQFYRKAESAATQILEAFRTGNLPQTLAPIFIHRKDNVPCRGWSWSNQLLVAIAGYSDARGYRQWQGAGRHVKKGERSFPILVPIVRKYTRKKQETGEEEEHTYLAGFTSASVFGLQQTEGDPLPPTDPEVRAWLDSLPLIEVARNWGLSVEAYNGEKSAYRGRYRQGQGIALGVKNLVVWAHELTHAADDRCAGGLRGGQHPDQEIVAQLGGSTLLEVLGYEADSDRGFSWEYIQTYAERAKLEPIAACQKLLRRSCAAVALILDTADELRQPNAQAAIVAG